MRMHIVRSSCAALILIAAAVANAGAQPLSCDDDSGEESSHSWGLGVAGITMQGPYADIDPESMIIPVIHFESRWVELNGATLQFNLPGIPSSGEDALSFGVRFEYDGTGYKQGDAPILDGMGQRSSGVLAGAAVEWDGALVGVSAEAMFDASSNSKGRRVSVGLERTFAIGEHLMITPSVAAIHLDRRYANYYFGVLPGEARPGREAYEPGSTVNAALGVRTDYLWGDHHVLFLQTEVTALGSQIRNGPLTDRAQELMLGAGYLFRF